MLLGRSARLSRAASLSLAKMASSVNTGRQGSSPHWWLGSGGRDVHLSTQTPTALGTISAGRLIHVDSSPARGAARSEPKGRRGGEHALREGEERRGEGAGRPRGGRGEGCEGCEAGEGRRGGEGSKRPRARGVRGERTSTGQTLRLRDGVGDDRAAACDRAGRARGVTRG